MSLAPGTRLGPYEVLAQIGAGGMGEVYRARDTRLNRDVAIKVLPETFAHDADRRARFEREAKSIAALSHPNIVAIFDTGAQADQLFVVAELLEGESLRDRLSHGALPAKKAVDIATQIARGLSAAHDKGIVHRDLKPENVFLLKGGHVKILDFGLAARVPTSSGATETVVGLTDPGTVMGTVGYMAPEQVRGLATDARTDLFALGAVLHEMLSGQRAFKGDTAADTMFAIVKEDPADLATVRRDVPPALDRVVRHALEKNPTERFQSARDVAFALEGLSASWTDHFSGSDIEADRSLGQRRSPFVRPMFVAALGLIGVLTGIAFVMGARWARSHEPVPTDYRGELLGGPAAAFGPRISPDGDTLAFQAIVDGVSQVAVMTPQSGDWTVHTHALPQGGLVQDLGWSADGTTILFDRVADLPLGIFSVPKIGGAEQLVLEAAMSPIALSDGTVVVTKINSAGVKQLYRFWPATQTLKALNAFPTMETITPPVRRAGRGRGVVFIGRASEAAVERDGLYALDVTVDGALPRRLAPTIDIQVRPHSLGTPLATTHDGDWVLFDVPAGNLHRIVKARTDGSNMLFPVATLTAEPYYLDIGADGSVYVDQFVRPTAIVRYSSGRGLSGSVVLPPSVYQSGREILPLPDGSVVVPMLIAGHDRLAVISKDKPTRFFLKTPEESTGPMTLLGPDHVAYLQGSQSKRTVAIATVDGRFVRALTVDGNVIDSVTGSPDGATLFYAAQGFVWSISRDGGEPRKIHAGTSVAVDPTGRFLIIQVVDKGANQLIRVALATGDVEPVPLSHDLPLVPQRALSSHAIAADGRIVMRVVPKSSWFWMAAILDPRTGRSELIPTGTDADVFSPAWTREGDVVMVVSTLQSSLWRFRPVTR